MKNLAQPYFRNPFIIALDVEKKDEAFKLVDDLQDLVGGWKLGPRLLLKMTPVEIERIVNSAPLFIDCKFFDIPSTMIASVRTCFEMGASACTIHSTCGPEAIAELAKLEKELNDIRPFIILCVTILTSWSEKSFPPVFQRMTLPQAVQLLAQSAMDSGLKGLVCSPHELQYLQNKKHYLVTPGIRSLSEKGGDDQTRTMTAKNALNSGSQALVIGRPVIKSANPREALAKIIVDSGIPTGQLI